MPDQSALADPFRIAEELGINANQADVFTDRMYLDFRERYRREVPQRDRLLQQHLADPKLFRAYLPLTDRTFAVAQRMIWYLDEIVVPDPVERALRDDPVNNIEGGKTVLVQALAFLKQFRWAVDSRFLLFLGKESLPVQVKDTPLEYQTFLDTHPRIVDGLDAAVQFGMVRRPDDRGISWPLYQATLDSGAIYGFRFKGVVGPGPVNSPNIIAGERFPRANLDAIAAAFEQTPSDLFAEARKMYAREVFSILNKPLAASATNSVLVVDRQIDADILHTLGPSLSQGRSDLDSLKLALPHLENVNPDRLAELRDEIPAAFIEFRALLLEVLESARTNHADNPMAWAAQELARRKAASERQLRAELDGFALKMRLAGLVGLAAGASALVGWNMDPAALAPLGFLAAGVTAALGVSGNAVHDQRKRKAADPFFFLWKATP